MPEADHPHTQKGIRMTRYAIDKTLSVNELRFHYRDWDGRGWPVLLLHGLSSTSHIWDLVAPLLVDEARVFALDLRGHGQSDKPNSSYSFDEVCGDVRGVMKALQFERPVLVGHSWGARVGLWMAARHSGELSGLIMVDGGVNNISTMPWEVVLEHLSPPKLSGMPVEEFRQMLIERSPQGLLAPAVEAAIMANFEIDSKDRILRRLPREYHLRILRAMWEQKLEELYKQVGCPTLILPARRKDHDDPKQLELKKRGIAQAEELITDVEVIWLEDTIHDAPLQRPHKLAEEIIRFLREQV